MENNNQPKLRSDKIILIVLCATLGFIVTLYTINANLIQYATLPKVVAFKTYDAGIKDCVYFNLKVKPAYAVDTIGTSKTAEDSATVIHNSLLYHENRFFPIWGMLILVMITIAAGACPVFIDQFITLKKDFKVDTVPVIKAVAYTVLIAVFLIASNSSGIGYYKPPDIIDDFHIIFKNGSILEYIVGATILLVAPVIAVMFLVGAAADKLLSRKITKDNASTIAHKLGVLNQVLLNGLYALSVIVVFTVLTSGTLKETIKATVQIEAFDIFPTEVSYAYGIYFSLFLCVIYMPVFFYLKQQVSSFRGVVAGMDYLGETKEAILANTDLKTSALDNIKTAITVLAPLITSFLPENLHFLK